MSFRRRFAVLTSVMALCIVLDQVTKRIAADNLKNHDTIAFLSGSVRLLYAENTGAFGSLGASWPPVFRAVLLSAVPALVLLGMAFYMLRKASISRLELYGYSLILGGGIGNLYDRVAYGHVIDFMYMGVGWLHTNIFNVADMALMAGIGLLALSSFRTPAPTATSKAA